MIANTGSFACLIKVFINIILEIRKYSFCKKYKNIIQKTIK